jgi:hypothetical protein
MAQQQFITYQADILSFEAREAMLGVLSPGRFCGFDILASNGTPSGGNIPLKVQHNGVKKLPKNGDTLLDPIGVVVTTQGCIIHEDQEILFSILDNSGGVDVRYSLLFMEHEYADGVSGDNPAIFDIVNGVSGGGIPTLVLDYKRVVIGVVEQSAGNTTISGCIWHPRFSDNILGDTKIIQKLFGPDANYINSVLGAIPSDGIIGNRVYDEENYISSGESISDSLDILDKFLSDIDNRAIDSEDWAPLSDNTNHDVSISSHGLMPKLPNDPAKFINGIGDWVTLSDSLLPENNLSDIEDGEEALHNLGGLTADEIADEYFADTGWQNLTRGTKVIASNYIGKIRRRGNIVTITAKVSLSNYPINDELFLSIPKANLNSNCLPTTRIYGQVVLVSSADSNRGFQFYVKEDVGQTNLEIRFGPAEFLDSDAQNTGSVFYINLTYICS